MIDRKSKNYNRIIIFPHENNALLDNPRKHISNDFHLPNIEHLSSEITEEDSVVIIELMRTVEDRYELIAKSNINGRMLMEPIFRGIFTKAEVDYILDYLTNKLIIITEEEYIIDFQSMYDHLHLN